MADRRLRCISLAALLLAVGCRAPNKPLHPQRWARAWLNALNSQRLEQVSPLLGETGTYEDPLTVKPFGGLALSYFLVRTWNAFPQLHFDLNAATGGDDMVVAEWTATGLGDGTGAPVNGVFVLHLRGQSIASVRGYFDPRSFIHWSGPKAAASTPARPAAR